MIILDAKNTIAGVVTGDDSLVEDATSTNALQRESEGYLIIDEKGAKYLALPVEDIKELLELSNKITTLVETVGAVPSVIGKTPAELNPAITTMIADLKTQMTGFKLT